MRRRFGVTGDSSKRLEGLGTLKRAIGGDALLLLGESMVEISAKD